MYVNVHIHVDVAIQCRFKLGFIREIFGFVERDVKCFSFFSTPIDRRVVEFRADLNKALK